jgi:RNA polymerase sigma-70 factor (ECF subfamily)
LDWNQVIETYGARLLFYARQWCRSPADAEDAVQDGLVRVWRKRREFNEDSIALLFTAVKRSALDRARSQERRRQREQRLVEERADDDGASWFEYDPESRERRAHIERALRTLPSEQREVLTLKIWGELTFQQVAKTLGIPANTAASRYRYALEALRRTLDSGELRDG